MAPLRSRAARVQNDQDQIFEGLPIRNWRREMSLVGPQQDIDKPIERRFRWKELPLPPDFEQLEPLAKINLRKARLPDFTISPPYQIGDENNLEYEPRLGPTTHLPMKRWLQKDKETDAQDKQYLAKRRKGLAPTAVGIAPIYDSHGVPKPTQTFKVRKLDRVYEVIVPIGQKVDGEIIEDPDVTVDPAPAPGTIIDGLGIVNDDGLVIAQPIRRRPPIPQKKRKKGGPGRSKKKIVTEYGPDGIPIHPRLDENGVPIRNADGSAAPSGNGDTPMGEAGDGEDDGDDDEGDDDGSGEEGEIKEDDDSEKDDDEKEDDEKEVAVKVEIEKIPIDKEEIENDTVDVEMTVDSQYENIPKAEPPDDSLVEPITDTIIEPTTQPVIESVIQTVSPLEPAPMEVTPTVLDPPPEPILAPVEPVYLAEPIIDIPMPDAISAPAEPLSLISVVPPVQLPPPEILNPLEILSELAPLIPAPPIPEDLVPVKPSTPSPAEPTGPIEPPPVRELSREKPEVELSLPEKSAVEENPMKKSPTEEPVTEEPIAEELPVKEPPVEQSPIEKSPVEQPPMEQFPVGQPPLEQPPVENPPVEQSSVESPSVEIPSLETPSVELPSVKASPTEEQPAKRITPESLPPALSGQNPTVDRVIIPEQQPAPIEEAIAVEDASAEQDKEITTTSTKIKKEENPSE